MKFTLEQTNPMTWNEFETIVNDLIKRVSIYPFDAVAPILRSGAIPGTMIGNKLKIIKTIPVQVKYNYNLKIIDVIHPPKCPEHTDKTDLKNILVTDCNTSSGKSAKIVLDLLKQEFPLAKIHYACVTKVYGGSPLIEGYETYHVGRWTNEAFIDDAPDYCRNGITIFPWETAELELNDINNDF